MIYITYENTTNFTLGKVEFWTAHAAKCWARDAMRHGFIELTGVEYVMPGLKNVGAVPDWLDIMAAGAVEFDLDEVEALRNNED